jgi:hypothetical protein
MPPPCGVKKKRIKKKKKKAPPPPPVRASVKVSPSEFVEKHAGCGEVNFTENVGWECEVCCEKIEENDIVDEAFIWDKIFFLLSDWNMSDDEDNGLHISSMQVAEDVVNRVETECKERAKYSVEFIKETAKKFIAE